MKKSVFFAAMMLLVASCTNEAGMESVEQANESGQVRVHVNNFTVSVEDFDKPHTTRATQSVADYTDVKIVSLALYDGNGTQVYKKDHNRDDATTYTGTTFGDFSCDLPVGHYTMVAIARGYKDGDTFTLTSPTSAGYGGNRTRETFCHTQSVLVKARETVDLDVTMDRVCSKVKLVSTDDVASALAKLRVTFSAGGMTFNPTTGLALDNAGFTVEATGITSTRISLSTYLFLTTDEQNVNVTIKAFDASDNEILSKVISNVPLQRNRVTKLSGNMFTANTSGFTFQINSDWLEETTIDF